MSRRRNVPSIATGAVATRPSGGIPMIFSTRSLIRAGFATAYYEGLDAITSGDSIGSRMNSRALPQLGIRYGINLASSSIIAPMISPMLGNVAGEFTNLFVTSGVLTGVKAIKGERRDVPYLVMDFFYNVGTQVAADATVSVVGPILGY